VPSRILCHRRLSIRSL